jgi:serine/threonine-protein kinase
MVLVVAGVLSAMTAMRFAIRGREVTVPELSGLTEAEARAILFDEGLSLDVESSRFSDSVPAGRILDQTPAPRVAVKRDRSVRVLLSLGDRPLSIPDVQGSSLRSAQMLFSQRGLTVGNTLYAHTDTGEGSTVVYQSPSPGEMSGFDPSVSVLVSLGPVDDYFIMPDLTGRLASAVTPRMRNEGFRSAEISATTQTGAPAGVIVGQQPAPGYRVSRNDVIRLEVGQ